MRTGLGKNKFYFGDIPPPQVRRLPLIYPYGTNLAAPTYGESKNREKPYRSENVTN